MTNFSKLLFLTLAIITLCTTVKAQTKFGNEWINPSKTYFKFKVAQDGMFRVTYEELVNVGFPAANTKGIDLKLFNYGIEQAIYVSDANEFGTGDYIEFYGEKNTIGLDSLLYDDWKTDLFNPEYSVVTDTNAYFLTVSPETNNQRYTQVNPDYNNNNMTPFPYYLHEEKVVYSSVFFKNVDGDTRYSNFEPSEGFGTGVQQNTNINFKTDKWIESGPAPIVKFRLGFNKILPRIDISWNNQLKDTKTLVPGKTYEFLYTLDKIEIIANNTLNIQNTFSVNDRHRISVASLIYPRSLDFDNKTEYFFKLPMSSSKQMLEITNFRIDNGQIYLYDVARKIRYNTATSNNRVTVIVNSSSDKDQKLILINNNVPKSVNKIIKFTPKAYSDEGQEYIIISNKLLYNEGVDYVNEYAEYRSSPIGGGYNTDVVEIQDIYDNFGYGIDRHFVGIKQFASYMNTNWSSAKFVFIIGKGVEYPFMRYTNDIINNTNKVFFIPTFGFTASDNMLFSEKNYPDPYFAIGRLAARTPDDIKNYLDKIKQYDLAPLGQSTIEDQYWMKRVLHLGGGKNDNEQTSIKNGLDNMGKLLQDTIYGADIYSFFKKSSEAIQFNINEEINKLFDNGVSIVNFFGHSATGSWDFSLENPRNFKNFGKYPFVNSFGCYSGNLHGLSKGISESFVLEKDRGAIAFFASTGTAFINSLSSYGYRMYNSLLNENRGKTIGEAIKLLATKNRNALSSEYALYTQLTFHGDPAIKVYLDNAPDYVFDIKSVKTNPSTVQASIQNYNLELDLVNIGAYQIDSFDITFFHHQPDNKKIDTIVIRTEGVANKKSISLPLKNYSGISVGKNKITAKIDTENVIIELPSPDAEANNELVINGQSGFEYFVTDNVALAIYPPDFAMINTKDHFVLKASTSSVPVPKADYVFQIDTTAYFNSTMKETGKVISEGGLILYQPKLSLVGNRVYYWRVSPDSISAIEGYKWSQASFAYLPDEEEGWNQSHFFQFAQNEFNDMEISEETGRKFEFGKEYHNAKFRNKLWDIDDRPGYTFNNVTFGSVTPWNYMNSGIAFVIYNKNRGVFSRNAIGGEFGSLNPTGASIAVYPFRTDTPESRKNITDFIKNFIKPNTFVTVFSVLKDVNSDLKISEWEGDKLLYGTTLFESLKSMGASKFDLLNQFGSVPYILQVEKGTSNFKVLNEEIASNINEIIEFTAVTNNLKPIGYQNSVLIGSVKEIKDLKFSIEDTSGEKQKSWINVKLVENSLETTIDSMLINGKNLNLKDFENKGLKLENVSFDSLEYTSPQLKFWRTSYSPLPDAAISFLKSEPNFTNNEINQGENLKVFYEVANVNYTDLDSLLVKYTMTTGNNQSVTTYKKIKPLKSGEKLSDVAEFNVGSGNFSEIRFGIEVNPDQTPKELYTFNNVLSRQYNVAKDKDNPLLDVYFDGLKIMDGDIVSPKPEILVTLADDNNFLPITDPELFEIKLDTGRNQFLEIPMTSPQIKFTPADQNNATAKVHYYPTLRDGEYRLIVQGKDASGNKSGINPRSITFKVIEKQSISNVLNYPNPFSTSTQFIFTLTGEEVPDIMSISILTLTGKVVKEITKDELGSLHIGINRTEYKWDGTDDFGSKLANGVYLYKVNSRKQGGEKYDQYSVNKIDNLFKDGFGKMVILR